MARKAKLKTIQEDAKPPQSREQIFADHFPRIVEAKKEADRQTEKSRKANSSYRSMLKAYKTAGGDVDSMVAGLALSKLEPEEIDRQFRETNWTLKMMGIPVGTQLGLFDDGKSVATHLEDAKLKANGTHNGNGHAKIVTRDQLRGAKAKGRIAGKAGKFPTDNPHEDGSPLFLAWAAGWQIEQEKLAFDLGKRPENRPAA
jgi:hypothetical protein